jgi:plasmid maintenance system antidote protein VapI
MNKKLKAKIIERFGSQADFAQEIQVDESIISRIVRGRRVLSPEDQSKWVKVLKCDPSILEPVTK